MSATARSEPADLGIEAPVPVGRLAAASPGGSGRRVPDAAEVAAANAGARLVVNADRSGCCSCVQWTRPPASASSSSSATRSRSRQRFLADDVLAGREDGWTCGWWRWFGLVRWTTSTRSSASIASTLRRAGGRPGFSAARSGEEPTTPRSRSQAPQRLDVDDADEACSHDGGLHRATLTRSQTATARLASAPTADRAGGEELERVLGRDPAGDE